MKLPKRLKIANYHHHVDNGGISFEVYQIKTDEFYDTFMEINTSYLGYPCLTTTLSFGSENPEKILTEIGATLISAAKSVKQNGN